jgi:hypothetical protein
VKFIESIVVNSKCQRFQNSRREGNEKKQNIKRRRKPQRKNDKEKRDAHAVGERGSIVEVKEMGGQ